MTRALTATYLFRNVMMAYVSASQTNGSGSNALMTRNRMDVSL